MFVKKDVCLSCGACASLCPVGAISLKTGKAEIDHKKCIKCGGCASVCPVEAISTEETKN